VFVSVKALADTVTNIVLSGDPKQLGPIIRSGIAYKLGLEISYLEQLMARSAERLGKKVGFGIYLLPHPIFVDSWISIVKSVQNFRSHEAILRFPNEHFYEGDLIRRAPSQDINAYFGSFYLPNKKLPIVFK